MTKPADDPDESVLTERLIAEWGRKALGPPAEAYDEYIDLQVSYMLGLVAAAVANWLEAAAAAL